MPDVEVERPDGQRDERVGEDPQALDAGQLRAPGRRIGPESPATKQSGARSPSMTCCSMWMKKKCSSPSASIGESSANTTSAIPVQKLACFQRLTGWPAGGERPRAAEVEDRDDHRRHDLQRLERPRAEERRRVHAVGRIGACTSSTTTSSPRSCGTSRPATSASSASTSSPATAGSATTTSRSRPARAGSSSTATGSSCGCRELERGAVNVVIQPGHWRLPRVDHLGVALDEDEFQEVLARAAQWNLRVQEHGGRRTFVATNAGYRIEVHPPRDWIDDLLAEPGGAQSGRAPAAGRRARAEGGRARGRPRPRADGRRLVTVGETVVRFLPGGPEGRPELAGERFA